MRSKMAYTRKKIHSSGKTKLTEMTDSELFINSRKPDKIYENNACFLYQTKTNAQMTMALVGAAVMWSQNDNAFMWLIRVENITGSDCHGFWRPQE